MKRLLAVLFLIPSLAFGAFTEFYCDAANGSNLNGGSDASGTATFTCTNGGWNSGTGVFTPACGTNPVSAGVIVGQFASVYIDGATVGVFVGRVTAVTNSTNGTITVSTTAAMGTAPTTSATARTIKVGGCWKGPNAAEFFPFNISGTPMSGAVNSSSDQVCTNMKNNSSYTVTSSATLSATSATRIQGYTSTVRDGGKAILTSNVTGSVNFSLTSGLTTWVDLIFVNTGASGSSNCVATASLQAFIRCVAHGSRGSGFTTTGTFVTYHECEAYDNNKSNTAGLGGFANASAGGAYYSYCYSHDNTGSNTSGFTRTGSNTVATYKNCIADTNGGVGISLAGAGSVMIDQCDLYNNGSDGVKSAETQNASCLIIQNSNFVKNAGKGINMTINGQSGMVANNGYGSGTQANGSSDSLKSLFDFGTSITYASGVTPWVDPANEDFNINLAAANFAGRGAFVQTDGTSSVTVGHPDIGAAQSLTGPGGTFSKEHSYGFSQ